MVSKISALGSLRRHIAQSACRHKNCEGFALLLEYEIKRTDKGALTSVPHGQV